MKLICKDKYIYQVAFTEIDTYAMWDWMMNERAWVMIVLKERFIISL